MTITICESPGCLTVSIEAEGWLFTRSLTRLKAAIPEGSRVFDRKSNRWLIDPAQQQQFSRWLKEMKDEYDCEINHERPTKPEPPSEPPPQLPSPYTVLHLLPSAPPELVRAAYRCLATLSHPDRGGTHEGMLALNTAYSQLMEAGR